ncbi:transmembrane protein, putative [Medicago truncatula]|uniref:Transmembrane protein, putative n=1 Tax=Medicago truncatula TaxID=3880 RepID=A0A072UHJ7_MEDTR|nr:transmembrane protein, putative [Medicago truncatula]
MAARSSLPIRFPVGGRNRLKDRKIKLATTLKDKKLPYHFIFSFLDALLCGALQVKYQNKKGSPFDDHKILMQIFLTSICIYCMLLGIKKYTKTLGGYGEQILSFAINLFGILSSASLLPILLPGQVFGVVLCVGGSILIILARHTLKIYVCLIINVMVVKISTMFSSIFKTMDSANGSNDTTYPNNPADLV